MAAFPTVWTNASEIIKRRNFILPPLELESNA